MGLVTGVVICGSSCLWFDPAASLMAKTCLGYQAVFFCSGNFFLDVVLNTFGDTFSAGLARKSQR